MLASDVPMNACAWRSQVAAVTRSQCSTRPTRPTPTRCGPLRALARIRDARARACRARAAQGHRRCASSRRRARSSRSPRSRIGGRDFRHRQRRGRRTRVAVTRKSLTVTPFATLLHFRKDVPRPGSARADRRADVGPFRDAAARNRAHDASPITTSTSPTGTTRATSRWRPAVSGSTNTSSTSSTSSARIGPGANVMASASPASRRWRRWR